MSNEAVVDFDYNGMVSSSRLSGEAKLLICADGLTLDGLFDRVSVNYADIDSIVLENYVIQVKTNGETIVISQIGQPCEWFHRDLLEAYNKKVLSAFHVTGEPLLETEGQYSYGVLNGNAKISVFSDCLCILSPNLRARRIPLVFINGLKRENYSLAITLNTEETYTFSMLGSDFDPLERAITERIRELKNNDITFVNKLIPSLGFSDSTKVGSLLREGIAVRLKQLPPVLAEAIEKKVRNSKAGSTYEQLKAICNHEHLAVGIKCLPDEEFEALKQAEIERVQKLAENAEVNPGAGKGACEVAGVSGAAASGVGGVAVLTAEQEDALRWAIWIVVPSSDGKTAVVELSLPGEDAATYLFRADTVWERFLMLLNRGMEATQFRREIISLSDEALKEEVYSEQRMLKVRTPALHELRKRFIGRVIHRSAESWKKSLLEKLGAGQDPSD